MVILGVADGVDTGAALVVDDQLVAVSHQSRLEGRTLTRSFPWAAVDQVLEQAGLTPADVDMVGVAGRITPPFFARRHPGLRASLAANPFSPGVDAGVFYQAMLRATGMGALEADRAAEWFEDRFAERGFRPSRLSLVDVHKALASAAYRGQERDHCLVLTLHPLGDGAAVAVHRALMGQVDRLWDQKGFSALHVHLQRCAATLGYGLDELHRMWGAAGRGTPDAALVELLEAQLRADGHRLSRRAYPAPSRRGQRLRRAMLDAPTEIAAASVLENLCRTVCELVSHHIARVDTNGLLLAGAIFDNPRLCARVAELPEVEWTAVYPEPGWACLAAGAALSMAGIHPRLLPMPGLGAVADLPNARRALSACGMKTRVGFSAANVLAKGGLVGRFAGRSGWGRVAAGSRSVLVRADDVDAVARARAALRLGADDEPVLALSAEEAATGVTLLPELRAGTRCGAFAPRVSDELAQRYPGAVAADGRALIQVVGPDDPDLQALLAKVRERSGCGALAVFPLARDGTPVVDRPSEAIGVFRAAQLDGLLLGRQGVAGGGA